jgi:hypothetical protein
MVFLALNFLKRRQGHVRKVKIDRVPTSSTTTLTTHSKTGVKKLSVKWYTSMLSCRPGKHQQAILLTPPTFQKRYRQMEHCIVHEQMTSLYRRG